MRKIFLCLFIFLSINCFSQNGLFEKGRLKTLKAVTLIDQNNVMKLESKKLVIDDSIKVDAQIFAKKIFAKNVLKHGRTLFEIECYLKKGKLFFIKLEEQSPRYSDLKKHTEYFVVDHKISNINYYYKRRPFLPLSMEDSSKNQFGYDENLTENFMKNYVFELYEKLNNSKK